MHTKIALGAYEKGDNLDILSYWENGRKIILEDVDILDINSKEITLKLLDGTKTILDIADIEEPKLIGNLSSNNADEEKSICNGCMHSNVDINQKPCSVCMQWIDGYLNATNYEPIKIKTLTCLDSEEPECFFTKEFGNKRCLIFGGDIASRNINHDCDICKEKVKKCF